MTILTHDRLVDARAQRKVAKPSLFDGLAATWHLWRRRSEERAALAAFGWRDMNDIGITSVEVLREINKPFWKA